MSRRPHWYRPNEANRYPRRIVCLDSEAVKQLDGTAERHRLRLAFATFDVLDRETLEPKRSEESGFVDAAELWEWVDARTTVNERTVVFAHNLAYDLRLTRALEELPRLGWELDTFSLDSYRCWLRWRRQKRSLLMVDTVSFVGRALEGFARDLGVAKPALPENDAPLEEWLDRCKADTRLLRELSMRMLRWLERGDHGNFRMTGPAQASASFRHKFLERGDLLVHADEDALAAERRSAWAGRCEVWRHGKVDETIVEWDFSLAYARLARDAMLPVRLRGEVTKPTLDRVLGFGKAYAVLAEVDVVSPAPVVPMELDRRIVWPVGAFPSTLWDVELAELVAAGGTAHVRRAWLYRRGPLLQEWATWIIDQLEGPNPETDPVARAMLKQWSRALIGRFGLRYPKWEALGDTADVALELIPRVSADTGETGAWLRLGHQVLEQTSIEESPDSCPAVMAYVMTLARRRLWRAIQTVPAGELLYVDTDSLLVTEAGSPALEAFSRTPEGEGLRIKSTYQRGTFWAPRQLELNGAARVAGLPRDARRRGRKVWTAEVWEGPQESIKRGHPGEVHVTQRTVHLRALDHRRRHLSRGRTAPVLIEPETA
jgi:hypothetical protein